jgi:hypothetical protein
MTTNDTEGAPWRYSCHLVDSRSEICFDSANFSSEDARATYDHAVTLATKERDRVWIASWGLADEEPRLLNCWDADDIERRLCLDLIRRQA